MPITRDTLNEAYDEAIRFCTRVEALRDAQEKADRAFCGGVGVASAAVRRASMDLTRSLAKLRSRA